MSTSENQTLKFSSHFIFITSSYVFAGQHNDARMNLAIGLTAARQGACLANHTEVLKLLKEKDEETGEEKICGATVRDRESGKSKCVECEYICKSLGCCGGSSIAIGALGLGFDSRPVKLDAVSPTTRHCCHVSLELEVVLRGH